jgi:hypothetical protein
MSKLKYPLSSVLFFYVKFLVQLVHPSHIEKYEGNEYVDGSLLCKPESQFEAANMDAIELIHKEDSESIAHNEPDGHQNEQEAQVFLPIEFEVFH